MNVMSSAASWQLHLICIFGRKHCKMYVHVDVLVHMWHCVCFNGNRPCGIPEIVTRHRKGPFLATAVAFTLIYGPPLRSHRVCFSILFVAEIWEHYGATQRSRNAIKDLLFSPLFTKHVPAFSEILNLPNDTNWCGWLCGGHGKLLINRRRTRHVVTRESMTFAASSLELSQRFWQNLTTE